MNETFRKFSEIMVRCPEVERTFCSENRVTFFLPGVDFLGVPTASRLVVLSTYFFACPMSSVVESALEMTLGATANSYY